MMNRREVLTGAVVTTARNQGRARWWYDAYFLRIRYRARRQFEPLRFLLTVCGSRAGSGKRS